MSQIGRGKNRGVNSTNCTCILAEITQTYAPNSSTLMKCPPKNTELLLSEIFKDPPIVPYKTGRSLKIHYFEQNFQSGYYYAWIGVFQPIFITEEFQRVGTAEMHREAVHSGLFPPLSEHSRKGLAHMIKKWSVSFDLL